MVEVLSRRLLQTILVVLLLLHAVAYYDSIQSVPIVPILNQTRSAIISSWRGVTHGMISSNLIG